MNDTAAEAVAAEDKELNVAKLAKSGVKKWTKVCEALPTETSKDVAAAAAAVLEAFRALERMARAEALLAEAKALRGGG